MSDPIRKIAVIERSDKVIEFPATLVSTAVDPGELEAVADSLQASPLLWHASWSSSADD